MSDVEELFDDKSEEENSDNEKQEKVGAKPQLKSLQLFFQEMKLSLSDVEKIMDVQEVQMDDSSVNKIKSIN